jgi:Ca-activated chloride channel homolog
MTSMRAQVQLQIAVLLVVLAACLAQQPPSIRVDVRLINVAFTVRNDKGAFVTDLSKDDFEVLDDGAPQAISFFARSADLPLNLGLIVDMSDSQAHFMKRHEHDLETFLKNVLSPRDSAFLLCFGNHLRIAADFSASPKVLMEGLKQFDHGAGGLPEIGPQELRVEGTAFYDALFYAATEKLAAKEEGRRALIVFSDGEDNSSAHHMLDAMEAAQSENVVIFGIRYTEPRKGRLTARNKYGIRVMARISQETGGADFDAQQDDLRKSFREIGEQLRSTYELAYHAAKPLQDGTFHKLVVRSKRPDLTVRAKTGYFARVE